MPRAMWWACVVAAFAATAWAGASWTIGDVSLSCAKTAETGAWFSCGDRAFDVLGIWPLVGVGLLLALPPVVAALTKRQWVSWLAVAALVGLSIAGLANWATTSYWSVLYVAAPLAIVGSVAAMFQRTAPPEGVRP